MVARDRGVGKQQSGNVATLNVSAGEWLAELERIASEPQRHADGLTTAEVAEHLGIGQPAALARVKQLVKAGKWEMAGKKSVRSIDGRQMTAPAYRPVKSEQT